MCAVACALALTATSATAVAPDAERFKPGAADVGDYLVPGYGNGGYDVSHYNIDVDYRPKTGMLRGTTTIRARSTQNLSRFNLDFALPARAVKVNGSAAKFKSVPGGEARGRELVVTPKRGVPRGEAMTIVVRYAAAPAKVKVGGASEWNETATGVNVWNEPAAASQWWFPGSHHPGDKATYDVRITAPARLTSLTNGRLVSRSVHDGRRTFHWRSAPMATYLTFLTIGRYDLVRRRAAGIPAWYAYERGGDAYMNRARADVARTPRVIATLARRFGRYPFGSTGGVVTRSPYATAFETQTRPQYTSLMWKHAQHSMWAVVHETAHQWFGDNVTMARWRHIWLAEGFATYGEWVWSSQQGTGTPRQLFLANYRLYPKGDRFWRVPVTRPRDVLDDQPYERGAMALQALRTKVGRDAFFSILRRWTRSHRHATATTADFAALAERVSGRQLDRFFEVWLHRRSRPAPTVRNGFPADLRAGSATDTVRAITQARTARALESARAVGR